MANTTYSHLIHPTMYASTSAFLVCSFLGFFLPSVAVVPQFHAERIGILMLIFWNGGGCFLLFMNGIIWRNDAINRAPVFCDISVYFYAGKHGGTLASILCILRRLHILLNLASRTPSAKEKRRMIMIDLIITIGIPVAYMGIHYLNAGSRAEIFEEYGCIQLEYGSVVLLITKYITALIIALISTVYGVKNLIKIRKIYSGMRATEYFNGDETANRYFRIMALSCVDLFFTIPMLVFYVVHKSRSLNPWISWANRKSNFSQIDSVPSALWRRSPSRVLSLELSRWTPVVVAFVWLIFFGYTNETRRLYGPILRRIWESTPFSKPRPALEPLTFEAVAKQPRRRQGEISDFSGLSTDRSDADGVPPPVDVAFQASLDVESQVKHG